MVSAVKICYAMLDCDSDFVITPVKLRGFLGHLFVHIPEFHHHANHPYHYPLIQYKKIDKKLAVVGIKEFAAIVLQHISELDHITTDTAKIPLNSIEIKTSSYQSEQALGKYRFTSPWLALNEKNYAVFKELKNNEKRPFLEKILVGNILAMFKGLGIFVDYRIAVNITKFKSVPVTAHNNNFAGIYAEFDSNTLLPNHLGLGKSVTKGMGVLKNIT